MSEFSVSTIRLINEANTMKSIADLLENNMELLKGIARNSSLSGQAGDIMKHSIKVRLENLQEIITDIKVMSIALLKAASLYQNAEQRIISSQDKQENPAFDDEGAYGGNQESPVTKSDELAYIVRRYYPDFTKDEVEDYLTKLKTEGCGYVALINTIFNQFVGKEEEFEKTFGFPMYGEDGDLNYDAMITDFYAATDNHNKKGILMFSRDEIDESEDESATKGTGTNRKSREYRWEKYLKEHGIDVDVKNVEVTLDNYDEMASQGDLVVGMKPCILYNSSGEIAHDNIEDIGHAMTITGKTDDGMYKVSSWGKEYYIKPDKSLYEWIEFQQIIY